jgi:hypothetical protein
MTALEVRRDEREPIRAPYQGDEPYVKNDHVYKTIHHRDRTAREYSEWLVHERTPSYMLILSLQRAQMMVDELYFVDEAYKPFIREFFEHEKPEEDDEQIQSFVSEIRECGFCSFDTEGAGELPSRPIRAGRRDRLFVSI